MSAIGPSSLRQAAPHPQTPALLLGAFLLCATTLLGAADPAPAKGGIDPAAAAQAFGEVQAICTKDGGALWGTNLYGALMFVDENTLEVATNGPDYQNQLKARGEIFTGALPDVDKIADNTLRWGGVTWTVLGWPLPEDKFQRDKLLLHQSFGRLADRLGVPPAKAANDHLDTRDGRVWLQLEWRALNRALLAQRDGQKDARKRAAMDALLFRAYRRSLFPGSAETERAAEDRDGLGEYTGVVLATKNRNEALAFAAGSVLGGQSLPAFSRLFAYMNGPAYGLLLDDQKPGWPKSFKGTDDLGDLLGAALGAQAPADPKAAAESRMGAYGGKELVAAEDNALAKRKQEAEALRARFVEGPILDIPVARGFNYAYEAEGKVALEGLGTVYSYVRVYAEWGSLVAEKGALLLVKDARVSGVRVPAPKDATTTPVKGEGWTLTLKPGWALAPAERKGDWTLKQTALRAP